MSHHRLIIPDPDAPPIKRATVRRVIKTFGPYRRTVGLVGALILVTSAIGVINPLLIKFVFDDALFCGPGCPNLGLLYRFGSHRHLAVLPLERGGSAGDAGPAERALRAPPADAAPVLHHHSDR
jgi:hypothetical protein